MAICETCEQEMTEADSCVEWRMAGPGLVRAVPTIRYGREARFDECEFDESEFDESELGACDLDDGPGGAWPWGAGGGGYRPPRPVVLERPIEPWPPRCGDCHVRLGGVHHPGCDLAECPLCGYQLLSCGCLDDEGIVVPPPPAPGPPWARRRGLRGRTRRWPTGRPPGA